MFFDHHRPKKRNFPPQHRVMHGNQFRHKAGLGLFAGPKCKVAIPVSHVLIRDAMQQASLDPSVRAIHYRKAPDPYGTQVTPMSVVLERIDGDFLLAICETRPRRSGEKLARLAGELEVNGLRLLERDALDVRREPLFSNARAVWSNERFPVSLRDRLRIAAVLGEQGPQSIGEIEEHARPTCDIIAAISALACEALVEIDIRVTPLGSRTLVRGR
jgi:hypothetical protein